MKDVHTHLLRVFLPETLSNRGPKGTGHVGFNPSELSFPKVNSASAVLRPS